MTVTGLTKQSVNKEKITKVKELLAAKKNPQQHKDVLVRVGGYSAYFVDLPHELQDEIIARTQHAV